MKKVRMTKEQIQQLINSWKSCVTGSLEQKLIEDLFLITETPSPFKLNSPRKNIKAGDLLL